MDTNVFGHLPIGFGGILVSVEVDLRRGLPTTEIVGLAGNAVREARERVRVALVRAGFVYPPERVLINLAPAGIPKSGASFDLAIATALLIESRQIVPVEPGPILVLGELELSGRVRGVRGVIAAVAAAAAGGIPHVVVPSENGNEARLLQGCRIDAVARIEEMVTAVETDASVGADPAGAAPAEAAAAEEQRDFAEMDDSSLVKRAAKIAAIGGHHMLLYGPPGTGKTMAAYRLPAILDRLDDDAALEVTRIHSIAGAASVDGGLIRTPPLRAPHHSASLEGIIGGGRQLRPGEISLAHRGILLLDEAGEFRQSVLQSLREPLQSKDVRLVRAEATAWYPADFQLVLTMNPCPCGFHGSDRETCICSQREVAQYWKRVGQVLLDRVELRLFVDLPKAGRERREPRQLRGRIPTPTPAPPANNERETTRTMRREVAAAREFARRRAARSPGDATTGTRGGYAAAVPNGAKLGFRGEAGLGRRPAEVLRDGVEKLGLSRRGQAAVVRVARSIADLGREETIGEDHILEALYYRRRVGPE